MKSQTALALCHLTLCLTLLPGCSATKPQPVDTSRYENLTTRIIDNADVLSTLEIDSGHYTLLTYEHFSNRRFVNHAFHGTNTYFKVDSLGVLGTRDHFEIPSDLIEVHAFRSNYRCFICKIDSIYGSLKTLHLSSDSITLAIDLKCAGQGQLLRDTIGFARDHDFFKTVFIDHQGEFDNLRLALKEPLNVRKLELFNHKLNMGSIAYRNLLAK